MDDSEQFRNIIAAYGGRPGRPGRKALAFWRRKGLSPQAIELLSGYNLKQAAPVGAVFFYDEAGVLETNADDYLPIALQAGLLVVGSCPNGDPVAVDVRDRLGQAGYLGHETMWDAVSVREVFAVLAPGLGALAAGLQAGAMPLNYYEAVKRRGSSP